MHSRARKCRRKPDRTNLICLLLTSHFLTKRQGHGFYAVPLPFMRAVPASISLRLSLIVYGTMHCAVQSGRLSAANRRKAGLTINHVLYSDSLLQRVRKKSDRTNDNERMSLLTMYISSTDSKVNANIISVCMNRNQFRLNFHKICNYTINRSTRNMYFRYNHYSSTNFMITSFRFQISFLTSSISDWDVSCSLFTYLAI